MTQDKQRRCKILCLIQTPKCTALYVLRTALNWTELNWTALHCTELHCTALHWTELHWTALHCTAEHCTVLHCTALQCKALALLLNSGILIGPVDTGAGGNVDDLRDGTIVEPGTCRLHCHVMCDTSGETFHSDLVRETYSDTCHSTVAGWQLSIWSN